MFMLKREGCACGHAGQRHVARLVKYQGHMVWLPGLGTCGVSGCHCEKFHFKHWNQSRKKRRQRHLVAV